MIALLLAGLASAAAFRGDEATSQTFTYQGQLRNAGQLVSGAVDLRFSLWDSGVGGTEVGAANTFMAYPLIDGRFGLGLNFGADAFAGEARWVQIEFRSPAGSGNWLTLSPRDKINATPYALYALNGGNGNWLLNAASNALTTSPKVTAVGIGTQTPSAVLEVIGAPGDDSVKLPVGSIGPSEISGQFSGYGAFAGGVTSIDGTASSFISTFSIPADGILVFDGTARAVIGGATVAFYVDDISIGGAPWSFSDATVRFRAPLTAGRHIFRAEMTGAVAPSAMNFQFQAFWVQSEIVFE